MASLEYIARKMHEFRSEEGAIELTQKRMRRLKSNLQISRQVIRTNTGMSSEDPHVRAEDFEEAGYMDYLLQSFFPDGNVPEELREYSDFVARFRGIDGYSEAYTNKLDRDSKALRSKDPLSNWESPIYAMGIVDVLEADETKEDESQLVVMVDGNELYKESIPLNVFSNLPAGTKVLFNYREQGLELDLKGILKGKSSSESSRIEKAVLESMSGAKTRAYIESVYEDINQRI